MGVYDVFDLLPSGWGMGSWALVGNRAGIDVTIILSCDQPDKKLAPDEVGIVLGMLTSSGIKVSKGLSRLRGKVIDTFICYAETFQQQDLIRSIARSYNQKFVLEVDDYTGFSCFNFMDGGLRTFVGRWHEGEARRRKDFTLDIETQKVYVTS
jgi:hypothetical protein